MARVLLLAAGAGALVAPPTRQRPRSALRAAVSKADVMKCLSREYRSFFAPLEDEYYSSSVTFDDPLNSLSGLKAYRNNVDMLAGRTLFGGLLFSDAAINLHDVRELEDGRLQTRWTLRVCFSALPWAPTARFTGISVYDLDGENKIKGQTDYWDSIDLKQGSYSRSSKGAAAQDFANQLFGGDKTSDGELPYELLRRADYSVRRYPAVSVAEVAYDVRPEGYDMLGSYTGGFNENDAKMQPFLPSIITVPRSGGGAKTMTWPVSLAEEELPGSRVVKTRRARELTVACLVFPQAATEDAVQCRAARQSKLMVLPTSTPSTRHLLHTGTGRASWKKSSRRTASRAPRATRPTTSSRSTTRSSASATGATRSGYRSRRGTPGIINLA